MCSTQHGGRFHVPPASAPLSISTSPPDKKGAIATAGNDYWNVEGNARLLGISGRGLRGWRAGPSADAVRLRQMTWVAETAKMLPPHALYQQCVTLCVCSNAKFWLRPANHRAGHARTRITTTGTELALCGEEIEHVYFPHTGTVMPQGDASHLWSSHHGNYPLKARSR